MPEGPKAKQHDHSLSDVEYEQVSESLRHYSNLRYAILSVFIAINAALLTGVYAKDWTTSTFLALSLRLFGCSAQSLSDG
jgi:hypothetical protein